MPRIARVVIPELPHHVTQRGNSRPVCVRLPAAWRRRRVPHLSPSRTRQARADRTNHVHLIGMPEREDSLAKAVGRTHVGRRLRPLPAGRPQTATKRKPNAKMRKR